MRSSHKVAIVIHLFSVVRQIYYYGWRVLEHIDNPADDIVVIACGIVIVGNNLFLRIAQVGTPYVRSLEHLQVVRRRKALRCIRMLPHKMKNV